MTYKEWANEYYESAMALKKRMSKLKEDMKSASNNALAEMSNRLTVMYGMYRDCMETADLLATRKGEC